VAFVDDCAAWLALTALTLASCAPATPTATPAAVVIEPAPVTMVEIESEGRPPTIAGMVYVSAGPFHRGCSVLDAQCYSNEKPARLVHIDAFYIDRLEVTVADYRRCVAAGECSAELLDSHAETTSSNNGPSAGLNNSSSSDPTVNDDCNWNHHERQNHPLNCVSWYQAVEYCEWRGQRLPTEAEWEKAARGTEHNIYPWGNTTPTCAHAAMNDDDCSPDGTQPVGQRPKGASKYGALDMVGNVWEWTADWYDDVWYGASPDVNPMGPQNGDFRVAKGGGWTDHIEREMNSLRISNRYSYRPDLRFYFQGFRCAKSAKPGAVIAQPNP
jgi:formylglycine-generating enzyme required for sulfatase activity